MDWAPIVLFVYNRLGHTSQTLNALQQCKGASQSNLIVFSDGSLNEKDAIKVREVRNRLFTIKGFSSVQVCERKTNMGLAQNIIEGVSSVVHQHGRVIVLEDDLICAPNFLLFMNQALAKYKDDGQIFSISGFNPPMQKPADYDYQVYLNPRSSSWGWASWEDRWDKVDWAVTDHHSFFKDRKAKKLFERGGEDMSWMLWKQMHGQLNSWAIRFCYAHFKQQAFSLCPIRSLVENIGHDGSGMHSDKTDRFSVLLEGLSQEPQLPESLEVNEKLMDQFREYYKLSLKKKLKKTIIMDLFHG